MVVCDVDRNQRGSRFVEQCRPNVDRAFCVRSHKLRPEHHLHLLQPPPHAAISCAMGRHAQAMSADAL